MRSLTTGFLALLLTVLAPQAMAGVPVVGILTGAPTNLAQSPLATKNFGSTMVGTPVDGTLETVTVHISEPLSGNLATIDAISATGDFTVTGGTCTNFSSLWTDSSTCTLQLRFAPLVAGVRNGLLSIKCSIVAAAGGIIGLVCDDSTHAAYNLRGTGIGANANPVPALSRGSFTLIALILVGASLFALRRRR